MLTDIGGIRVGHSSDQVNKTGCTVVLFDEPTVGGVDVRGTNSSTKDTDLLRPTSVMPIVHAVLLTGGSSYGLEAASGVTRYLESVGQGFDTGFALIPIVPAAVIYDLAVGNARVRPDLGMGIEACRQATSGKVETGSVGAGTGATLGKLNGTAYASRGGVGTAVVTVWRQIKVGAIAVVNAFGDVIDRQSGEIIAGSLNEGGEFIGTYERQKQGALEHSAFQFGTNTTLGVVSTNCRLTKVEANRVASIAQNGIARAISPAHTSVDGDVIFATGRIESDLTAPVDLIGSAAAEAMELAILDAVRSAR